MRHSREEQPRWTNAIDGDRWRDGGRKRAFFGEANLGSHRTEREREREREGEREGGEHRVDYPRRGKGG